MLFPILAEKYGIGPARTGHDVPGISTSFQGSVHKHTAIDTATLAAVTAIATVIATATATATATLATATLATATLATTTVVATAINTATVDRRCRHCRNRLRPRHPRCPSRTEKRKIPELTRELGLGSPGVRARVEP